MSCTLEETLGQIDPYVKLSNGTFIHPVGHWLKLLDPADSAEYILCVDSVGRLLIHELDFAGYMIFPPAFVEQKASDPHRPQVGLLPQFNSPQLPSHYI